MKINRKIQVKNVLKLLRYRKNNIGNKRLDNKRT